MPGALGRGTEHPQGGQSAGEQGLEWTGRNQGQACARREPWGHPVAAGEIT